MRIAKIIIFTILAISSTVTSFTQAQSSNFQWFPGSQIFPALEYDLLETQVYSGIFYLNTEKEDFTSAYIPVNLGFTKPFMQWQWSGFDLGLALGVASYTQFEVERYDANTLRGGLLNIDYKASGLLYLQKGKHIFRLQLFHMSSHLGDDYMIRNEYFQRNDKSRSYEEINLTYYYQLENLGIYACAGEVISPNVFRKRFMAQGGFQAQIPVKPNAAISYGSDIKIYEENNFEPDIHCGIGIKFSKIGEKQLSISFDGYYGYLPYSTLDYGKVFWAGISAGIWL
ncbi:MAG: DUF1207 domain-containing protein [Bacteroidetes bacterium]|jgi:hypothetical protein|nr:DUF1207 domain-containing protein [Bacteroidota bacterium]MBT3748579.1 DUF1207 domain-containing protein [Bacteroidota bacterium]MBT4399523.1 DUF1207 domain-containing protein [Bacteroidota bacterium]MBT4412027.1 DUF1207 domain-containing protein [Bacteroidota bacterium]MBT5427581.1 DUF1207 domain-containing protein [Bacteroidota bacterium]